MHSIVHGRRGIRLHGERVGAEDGAGERCDLVSRHAPVNAGGGQTGSQEGAREATSRGQVAEKRGECRSLHFYYFWHVIVAQFAAEQA